MRRRVSFQGSSVRPSGYRPCQSASMAAHSRRMSARTPRRWAATIIESSRTLDGGSGRAPDVPGVRLATRSASREMPLVRLNAVREPRTPPLISQATACTTVGANSGSSTEVVFPPARPPPSRPRAAARARPSGFVIKFAPVGLLVDFRCLTNPWSSWFFCRLCRQRSVPRIFARPDAVSGHRVDLTLTRSIPIVVGCIGWLRSWLRLTLASFAFPPCRGTGRRPPHQFERIVW